MDMRNIKSVATKKNTKVWIPTASGFVNWEFQIDEHLSQSGWYPGVLLPQSTTPALAHCVCVSFGIVKRKPGLSNTKSNEKTLSVQTSGSIFVRGTVDGSCTHMTNDMEGLGADLLSEDGPLTHDLRQRKQLGLVNAVLVGVIHE